MAITIWRAATTGALPLPQKHFGGGAVVWVDSPGMFAVLFVVYVLVAVLFGLLFVAQLSERFRHIERKLTRSLRRMRR